MTVTATSHWYRPGYVRKQTSAALPSLLVLGGLAAAVLPRSLDAGESATRVLLNGTPAPVYFNDGDSFRVLAGAYYGGRARLGGFNTLESFGPAHQWGEWHPKELYNYAKLGTLNAMRGAWTCTSDMQQDTYGRTLWMCKDLALDQVRRGLAHAMSVTEAPADPDLMAAQAEAIREGRGMWARGVPEYVMTSLHSYAEGGGPSGRTYNRLVSTRDGHSVPLEHKDSYGECQWVCTEERKVPEEIVAKTAERLRGEPEMADAVAVVGGRLQQLVGDYARLGWFGGVKDKAIVQKLETRLGEMRAQGLLGDAQPEKGSCMLFVPFERRYGKARPDCLR